MSTVASSTAGGSVALLDIATASTSPIDVDSPVPPPAQLVELVSAATAGSTTSIRQTASKRSYIKSDDAMNTASAHYKNSFTCQLQISV